MRRLLPRWRKATWALLIVNALMLIWFISAISTTGGHATDCNGLSQSTCDSARNVGAGIAAGIIVFFWFIVFVVFSLIWLMSRPNKRICPSCGRDVKKGLTACSACGYNFAAQPQTTTNQPVT